MQECMLRLSVCVCVSVECVCVCGNACGMHGLHVDWVRSAVAQSTSC